MADSIDEMYVAIKIISNTEELQTTCRKLYFFGTPYGILLWLFLFIIVLFLLCKR